MFCHQPYPPWVYFLLVPLFCFSGNLQAQCCNDPICTNEAKGYVNRFLALTASPLFADPPAAIEKDLKAQLNEIKKQDKGLYTQFIHEIQAYSRWLAPEEGFRASCVWSQMEESDDITADWMEETTSLYRKFQPYSPEFCRGFRMHVELGNGIKDVGLATESYLGSLSLLASYTFAPTDPNIGPDDAYCMPHCNGRFRLALGISESYVDQVGVTQGLFRVEAKLADLKSPFFSIGNLKGIAQTNIGINREYHSVSFGLGAEAEIIGFHLMYGIGLENIKSTLQASLVYHFKLKKSCQKL